MKLAPLLLACSLLLLLSGSTRAQGGVSVEVDAGFDGYYSRYEGGVPAPTPVRIRLSNTGEGFGARVEVDGQLSNGRARMYAEVDLPRNSAKVVTLYPTYSGFTPSIEVRVLDGSRLAAKKIVPLRALDADGELYGVLSGESQLPEIGTGKTDQNAVVQLTPDSLPDRADALGALSGIVVDGPAAAELTDGQRAALDGWVQLGGRLVVAGGSGGRQAAAGLGDLVPVTVATGQNARELPELARLANVRSAPPPGGGLARGTPKEGARVLADSPQGPLVVSRTLGAGSVAWLAWSPSASPWREWEGNAPLLRSLATGRQVARVGGTLEPWGVNQLVQGIAGAQLPSTWLVAAFLLVYALVLGPGLYVYLKRRDQKERAWLLVPALTLLFSVLAYGSSFLIRGQGTILRTLEVVDAYEGSDAQAVTTYASIFSHGRRGYDVAMPSTYAVSAGADAQMMGMDPSQPPARELQYTAQANGRETVLRDLDVEIYAFRSWTTSHVATGSSPALEARLEGDGTTVDGEVRNTSGAAVEDAWVLFNGRWQAVGTIAPGQAARLSPTRSDGPGIGGPGAFNGAPDRRSQLMQYLGQPQVGPNGEQLSRAGDAEVLVVGWQKQPQRGMRVVNAQAENSGERLLVLHTGYALKRGRVEVNVEPRAATNRGAEGPIELTYALPEGVTARTLTLSARSPDSAAFQAKFAQGGFGVGVGVAQPVAAATVAPLPGETPLAGVATPEATPAAAPGAGLAPEPPGAVEEQEFGPDGMPIDPSVAEVARSVRSVQVRDPETGEYGPNVLNSRNPTFSLAEITDAGRYVGRDGTIVIRITGRQDALLQPESFGLRVTGSKK